MRKSGFSMIEVLIAVTIVGVIGVFISTILTRTYRASTQSSSIGKLKENGQVAMDVMVEAIRNAEGVVCYGGAPTRRNAIVIRTLQGDYIRFRFVDPNRTGNIVTSNGYVMKQEGLDPLDYSIFCEDGSSLTSPTPIILTNNNNFSGVSISGGEFEKLTPNTTSKDAVMISFKVNRSLSQDNATESDTIMMQTTVQVR